MAHSYSVGVPQRKRNDYLSRKAWFCAVQPGGPVKVLFIDCYLCLKQLTIRSLLKGSYRSFQVASEISTSPFISLLNVSMFSLNLTFLILTEVSRPSTAVGETVALKSAHSSAVGISG